jgi:hypothetical protein
LGYPAKCRARAAAAVAGGDDVAAAVAYSSNYTILESDSMYEYPIQCRAYISTVNPENTKKPPVVTIAEKVAPRQPTPSL